MRRRQRATGRASSQAYQAALKARRDGDDLGMLLQIAMVLWKHLNDLEQAEEYFRRIRKLEPAHPAALDFYRAYYAAKGESGKLISLLKQRREGRAAAAQRERREVDLVEIAELAEAQNNPEKAIEAWKQHLRQDPTSVQARSALARLYRRTEKWNALLDLMKDEIEKLPESDVAGRVGAAVRGRGDLSRSTAARRDGDQHLQRDPQARSGQPARDRRARCEVPRARSMERSDRDPDEEVGSAGRARRRARQAAARGRRSVVGAVRQLRERDQAARADRRARADAMPKRSASSRRSIRSAASGGS